MLAFYLYQINLSTFISHGLTSSEVSFGDYYMMFPSPRRGLCPL